MTVVYLVGAGAGAFNPPSSVTATVECWGAGQASDAGATAAGGKGAAYARKNSLSLTAGVPEPFSLGAPGLTPLATGGDTWFHSSGTVLANGGNSATSSVGDLTNAGGGGGGAPRGGGGGAGGPDGTGQAGTASSGPGGAGDNGSGGAGGATNAPGQDNYDKGGGGGGGGSSTPGTGGTPGGGGGGGDTGRRGGFALIKITYTGTDANQIIVRDSTGNFTTVTFPGTSWLSAQAEAWGGGGGGENGALAASGGAGGGGAYSRKNQLTLAATLAVALGAGGGTSGAGGDTNVVNAGTLLAKGGAGTSGTSGGAGGAAGSGVGDVKTSGGIGGAGGALGVDGAGGGGGAGGIDGTGTAGTIFSASNGGAGGQGDGSTGGAGGSGGVLAGAAAAAGTSDARGGGGGGGGAKLAVGANGGYPGGAGGGGGGGATETAGSGADGQIILTQLVPYAWFPFQGEALSQSRGVGGNAVRYTPRARSAAGPLQVSVPSEPAFRQEYQQPPHRAPELKGAAVALGDGGTQATFVNWKNTGHEVQPVQPPARPLLKSAGLFATGDQTTLPNPTDVRLWRFLGFEVQPPQPAHPRPERFGALVRGDDGMEAPEPKVPVWGYDVAQTLKPRKVTVGYVPRPRQASGPAIVPSAAGWEAALHQPQYRQPRFQHPFGTADYSLTLAAPIGWEIQSLQPPHLRPEKTGSLLRGDEGNQAPFIPSSPPIPWGGADSPFVIYRYRIRLSALAGAEDGRPALVKFIPEGWEVQPWQPPHRAPEVKGAAVLRGDDGIEGTFYPWRNFGWEVPQTFKRRIPFVGYVPTVRHSTAPALIALSPAQGWDAPIQPPQYRRPRSDFGFTSFGVPLLILGPTGWEVQAHQPRHLRREAAGAIQPISNLETPPVVIPLVPIGGQVQSWQPPHLRIEKAASLLRGDEGTYQRLLGWVNDGWEIQPVQPNHPRPERSGSIARSDDGAYAVFVPPAQIPWGWELQAHQPGRPMPVRGGTLLYAVTVEARLSNVFQTFGWEIQPPQPPAFSRARGAGFMRGDDGFSGKLVVPFGEGWAVQPWQPPHYRPEVKAGAWLRGEDGIAAKFIGGFFAYGWDVQPFQPPLVRVIRAQPLLATMQLLDFWVIPPAPPTPPGPGFYPKAPLYVPRRWFLRNRTDDAKPK